MGGIYDNEKAGKWKVIKDMTVIGAMRNPSQGRLSRGAVGECFVFISVSDGYCGGMSVKIAILSMLLCCMAY